MGLSAPPPPAGLPDDSPPAVDANELARRWQTLGDQQAREELCERFLPLTRRLAGRYRSAHEPLEDLVQVAAVGLLGAIDRFDPARGSSFPGFAIPTILGELKRYFRSTGWTAHVPRGAQELALRVDRASQELSAQTGHSPRVTELSAYLELDIEEVLAGLDAQAAHYAVALDAPAPGTEPDDPPSLRDTLGNDDERLGLVETKLSLAAAIPRLPYLERQALTLRIEGNLKQGEIGQQLGCSQMQVSRLLRRAVARLQELMEP
ncbi:MAG TPA: sigma-70 family RNA polymerase sigma factor [Solirubrobacteraceae bacterium]|jgi:RNA polymerase sigma-B factor